MKAVTVRQPWASLIAAGVKTVETRPRACSYRGRIAIHAAQWQPPGGTYVGKRWCVYRHADVPRALDTTDGSWHDLPLGAVVASAVLTDCLPVVGYGIDRIEGIDTSRGCITHPYGPDRDEIRLDTPSPSGAGRMVSDQTHQLPFGDFSPGRWALLLDDIAPTTERCPWCWGENHSGLDKLTEVHAGSAQVGHSTTMHAYTVCSVCEGAGRCDPVPARGQQAVPWNWQP